VTDAIYAAMGAYHARTYVNGLNVGTYLPVAIPIKVFGKSEFALSVWPLMSSALGVASVAGAAGLLFGASFGVLAGLLYAIYPGDVFFSTVVMPDSIQAGWLSFSMFLIVAAFGDRFLFSRRNVVLMVAGAAMGVCHLVRANDVLLVPVGVGAVFCFSRIWKRDALSVAARNAFAYGCGWLLVVMLEGFAYWWAAGDFLLRVHAVSGHYGGADSIVRWGLNIDPATIPFSIFAPVMWWFRGGWGFLNQDQAYHGLLFFWALIAVAIGLVILGVRRNLVPDRAAAGFIAGILWLAWPLLYHEFGTQSLTAWVPMHRLSRHLVVDAPGAIFATIAGAYLIWDAVADARFRSLRAPIAVVGCAVLAVHSYVNWKGERISYEAYQGIKSTYVRIRSHLPDGVRAIIADPGDLCYFDFWLNPVGIERVKMLPFAAFHACSELREGVVLTESNRGWEPPGAPIIQETVERLPCLVSPPANWRLAYRGSPERMYVIE